MTDDIEKSKAGASFEGFLKDEGTCEATTGQAVKRVPTSQHAQVMKINPALRRGIIRAHPAYFDMSIAEQENYRVSMPSAHEFIIRQQIYRDLFGIEIASEDDLREAERGIDLKSQNAVNEIILPIQGIGDDLVWLNEFFGDKTILDFDTLHDYAFHDHTFQESARAKEFADYEPQLYRGSLYGTWARLQIDGRLVYASLFCAAGYLLSEIEGHASEVLQRLIPHKLVPGDDHGKSEGSGTIFDFKIDANGHEDTFEELRRRSWQYQRDRYTVLLDLWDNEDRCCAWKIDTSEQGDPACAFIFSDKNALKSVRFRHFLNDTAAIEADQNNLEDAVKVELSLLNEHLKEQLADIEENFDFKVTKLRKKRKIIMTPEALADLQDLT